MDLQICRHDRNSEMNLAGVCRMFDAAERVRHNAMTTNDLLSMSRVRTWSGS